MDKSIRYYSSIPPNLQSFTSSDLTGGKEIVFVDKVHKFKCKPVKGKNSTLRLEWEEGKNSKFWIFCFSTSKIMFEWNALV